METFLWLAVLPGTWPIMWLYVPYDASTRSILIWQYWAQWTISNSAEKNNFIESPTMLSNWDQLLVSKENEWKKTPWRSYSDWLPLAWLTTWPLPAKHILYAHIQTDMLEPKLDTIPNVAEKVKKILNYLIPLKVPSDSQMLSHCCCANCYQLLHDVSKPVVKFLVSTTVNWSFRDRCEM